LARDGCPNKVTALKRQPAREDFFPRQSSRRAARKMERKAPPSDHHRCRGSMPEISSLHWIPTSRISSTMSLRRNSATRTGYLRHTSWTAAFSHSALSSLPLTSSLSRGWRQAGRGSVSITRRLGGGMEMQQDLARHVSLDSHLGLVVSRAQSFFPVVLILPPSFTC